MRRGTFVTCLLATAVVSTGLGACGADVDKVSVLTVPGGYPTIQEAVDAAQSGDIVEIAEGSYGESVKVSTDGIIIRGVDRNKVVIDGEDARPNGILVAANGVSVQNLTVRRFTQNGVVFNGIEGATRGSSIDPSVTYGTNGQWIDGFHVSHVTSYNNGLYGIYAFASTNGVIEDSYVSGHPDSGIYVGQCKPCNTVVRRVVADTNAIGYYGTNASGNVYVINSTFSNNRIGIAPNSQKAEKLSPQEETFVVGNTVVDNDNPRAPNVPDGAFGLGVAVGGGTRNLVSRNLVTGHDVAGIAVMTLGDFAPENNRIEANTARDNGVDIAFSGVSDGRARGNCFVGNTYAISLPERIDEVLNCDSPGVSVPGGRLGPVTAPPAVDYRKIAPPPPQVSLTRAGLKERESVPRFALPDLSAIVVPSR